MRLLLALLTFSLCPALMAVPSAFAPTAPDVIELKTLPAGTLLKSVAPGEYFEQSGRLFGPLFRYISKHDIRMTVPVEAELNPSAMYFWVAPDEVPKVAGPTGEVAVVQVPERRVAAAGGRAATTEKITRRPRHVSAPGSRSGPTTRPAAPRMRFTGTDPLPLGSSGNTRSMSPSAPKTARRANAEKADAATGRGHAVAGV